MVITPSHLFFENAGRRCMQKKHCTGDMKETFCIFHKVLELRNFLSEENLLYHFSPNCELGSGRATLLPNKAHQIKLSSATAATPRPVSRVSFSTAPTTPRCGLYPQQASPPLQQPTAVIHKE